MKSRLLIIAAAMIAEMLVAQPTTITVLGRQMYEAQPTRYVYSLHGSGISNERLQLLSNNLDSLNLRYFIEPAGIPGKDIPGSRSMRVSTPAPADFETIVSMCNALGLDGTIGYSFAHASFQLQDTLAMKAFDNARHRGEIIANLLGKRIRRTLNIDDHVEQYYFYSDLIPRNICDKELALQLLELLFGLSETDELVTTDKDRTGQYALWVTFELE